MGRLLRSTLRVLQTSALVIVVLSLAGPAAADGRLGFFIGLNYANLGQAAGKVGEDLAQEFENQLGGSWTSEEGGHLGLGGGVSYFRTLSQTLGFQLEVQYIRRGANYDLRQVDGISIESDFNLDYIEVPLLLRFTSGSGGSVQAIFLVGPVLSIQTGAKSEFSGEGSNVSIDVSDNFKSTSFGALGGIGLTFPASEELFIFLQARYLLGLTNVLEDPSQTSSFKHSDLGIFYGLEFPLGK